MVAIGLDAGWAHWVAVRMWNLGILSGKTAEVCNELRKRIIDMCFLQEMKLKGQGARTLEMNGRRYNL